MLNEIKMEANKTYTENGAVTYATTMSDCLDFFATAGALRNQSETDIVKRFASAFAEDRDIATKLLFYARDVRGGLGERNVFRAAMKWLANFAPETVIKNIPYIAEFGRYDDLLALFDTVCEKDMLLYVKERIEEDIRAIENNETISLLAKWLPSVNTSNRQNVLYGKRIAKALGMKDCEYRKLLTKLRAQIRIIENNLREKDYSFDYSKQPSKALFKYRAAFLRNDEERYRKFLSRVATGESKLNTATLTPYDIIAPCYQGYWNRALDQGEREAMNVSWNALEDFTNGENALVVADGSGSMYCSLNPLPAAIAQSLAIYFAERNSGEFANHFITFSNKPQLVEIKGSDIYEKVCYCAKYNEVADTNIEAVFDLLLNTAVKHKLPQEELPSTLYIISDMEFNECATNARVSNFENAKQKYELSGYRLPRVVFWNVASRNQQQPVTKNEQGVILVSGVSPRIFKMLETNALSPFAFMLEIAQSDRYAKIAA